MNRSSDWLSQAERDLRVAESLAAGGYHEWTAFAALQSGEKAAKALVQSLHGASRGHSITAIFREVPASLEISDVVLGAARELDQVYVTARYPNGFAAGIPADYFSDQTSQRLLNHARNILEFCRSKVH